MLTRRQPDACSSIRTRVGEVGEEVLRDRRHLAGDGVVVAVIAISRATGALAGEPEVIARGYVVDEGQAGTLFRDAAQGDWRVQWKRRASKNGPTRD